jgi:hypothetical protein
MIICIQKILRQDSDASGSIQKGESFVDKLKKGKIHLKSVVAVVKSMTPHIKHSDTNSGIYIYLYMYLCMFIHKICIYICKYSRKCMCLYVYLHFSLYI